MESGRPQVRFRFHLTQPSNQKIFEYQKKFVTSSTHPSG